jgi:hypothetical protein
VKNLALYLSPLILTAPVLAQNIIPTPFAGTAGTEGFETQTQSGPPDCVTGGVFSGAGSLCAAQVSLSSGWNASCTLLPNSGTRFFGSSMLEATYTFGSGVSRFGGRFSTLFAPSGGTATFYDEFDIQIGVPQTISAPNGCVWTWNGWDLASAGLPDASKIVIRSHLGNGSRVFMDDMEADIGDHGNECEVVAGECCGGRPSFTAAGYSSFGSQVSITTASPTAQGSAVVAVHNLGNANDGPFNVDYGASIYSGPTWTAANMGSIFGVTLDTQGNIYVAHSTCYFLDLVGTAGDGAVYRIDASTSAVSTFATLPNSGPGLGNLCYDCENGQFFVSNMDDGMIYRLNSVGAILSTFDFGAADNPSDFYAPLGDRIWAVQKHNDRLYFGVWIENDGNTSASQNNEVWSIALNGAGDFSGTAKFELSLPNNNGGHSNPISDMRFTQSGSLLVAERGMSSETIPSAHNARLMEFVCAGGAWAPSSNNFGVGVSSGNNSAGGVDVSPGECGRVYVTGDALQFSPDVIYGTQGLPLNGGTVADSILLDFNSNLSIQDKTQIGDVAVPCEVEPAPCEGTTGTTGTAFCFGENGTCPCGNDAPAGSGGGCLNSTGQSAVLSGVGNPYSEYAPCPSVSPAGTDTVKLTATGMPNAPALLFKGTSDINGGNGVPFGDGLRCCGGQIVRVEIQMAVAGTVSFGFPNSKLSIDSESCGDTTYCYQVWYREVSPLCSSVAFNLTNAFAITWLP